MVSAAPDVEIDPRIVGASRAIESRIATAILGKEAQVRLAASALIVGEHILLDDLPGVGKTTLGTALAQVVGGTVGRVQGTPDLLPTDLTGSTIYDQREGEWIYRPGPLSSNVVLVDEVNRITPRTQSALLEAMAEGQITIDGETRPVPVPFLVVATMNPSGAAGTFPLTDAQLDRFGVSLSLGPVDRHTERRLLRGDGGRPVAETIEPVLPAEVLPELQAVICQTHVADQVLDYVLDLCDALRLAQHLSLRAPRSLISMSRGLAVLEGRGFVIPDDVKRLAVPCLAHRLATDGVPVEQCGPRVRSLVEELPVPSMEADGL